MIKGKFFKGSSYILLVLTALNLSSLDANAIEIPEIENNKKENGFNNPPDLNLESIEKIKVTDIVINGTDRKESALIAMFIKKGDSVTSNQIREDLQRIFGLGYFTDVQASKEPFLDGFRIVVNVIENPVLKDIEVFGNTIVKTETFHDVFNNQVGKIINLNDVRESIDLLRKAYSEKGYEAVSISPQLLADGRIFFNINEGVIEEIRLDSSIEGKLETKPEIIMREIRQKKGDIFNIAIMREDLRRVYNTNFFENVDIKPSSGRKNPNHIIIDIVVKEKQTGSINLGAGYNTRDGIVGTFSISKDNIFGTGQRLLVDLQAGAGWLSVTGANWLGRFDWYEPWFLPQYLPPRTGLGFSIYRQRQGNFFQDVNPFKLQIDNLTAESRYILISDRTGASLNLGGAILGDPLTTPWRLSTSVRAEMISPALPRVEDVLVTKPIENNQTKNMNIIDLEKSTDTKEVEAAKQLRSEFSSYVENKIKKDLTVSKTGVDKRFALSTSLSYDTRDFAAEPRDGWNNILSVEPSFGDVNYWKYFLTINKYTPIPYLDKVTFALGARAGILAGDPSKISVYERFFSGGFDVIRGWPENGYLSGENVVVSSAEVRFPIYNIVSGVLFFDVGNFWNQNWKVTSSNIRLNPNDSQEYNDSLINTTLRYGVGLGLRLNTPLGALRADYGVRDITRPFDLNRGAQFHFNIGQKF